MKENEDWFIPQCLRRGSSKPQCSTLQSQTSSVEGRKGRQWNLRKRWSSLGRKTVSDTPVVTGFPFWSHVTLTTGGENLSMKQMRVLGSPSSTGLFGSTVTSGGTGGHMTKLAIYAQTWLCPSTKTEKQSRLCPEKQCHSLRYLSLIPSS